MLNLKKATDDFLKALERLEDSEWHFGKACAALERCCTESSLEFEAYVKNLGFGRTVLAATIMPHLQAIKVDKRKRVWSAVGVHQLTRLHAIPAEKQKQMIEEIEKRSPRGQKIDEDEFAKMWTKVVGVKKISRPRLPKASTQILDGLVTLIRHWCASNPKLKEDIRQQPHLYTHVFGRDEEKPKKKRKGA